MEQPNTRSTQTDCSGVLSLGNSSVTSRAFLKRAKGFLQLAALRLEFEWVIFLSFLLWLEFDTLFDTMNRIWLEFEWVIFPMTRIWYPFDTMNRIWLEFDTIFDTMTRICYYYWYLDLLDKSTTLSIISGIIAFDIALWHTHNISKWSLKESIVNHQIRHLF